MSAVSNIANNVTAGRDSRLAVYGSMDWQYQDSGMLGTLIGGNLDASDRIATGSTYAVREIERTGRNSPAPKLASREGDAP